MDAVEPSLLNDRAGPGKNVNRSKMPKVIGYVSLKGIVLKKEFLRFKK